MGQNYVFQQDNSPNYVSKLREVYLQQLEAEKYLSGRVSFQKPSFRSYGATVRELNHGVWQLARILAGDMWKKLQQA